MKILTLAMCVASCLMAFATHAQERAAGGAVDMQMTWSALSGQINSVNTKVDAVDSRVVQIVVCGKKGLIYAPDRAGADAQGCVEAGNAAGNTDIGDIITKVNSLTTNLNSTSNTVANMLVCGKNGNFSSADGKTCTSTSSDDYRWVVTNTVSNCSRNPVSGTRCGAGPGSKCTAPGTTCMTSSLPGVYVPSSGSCCSSCNGPYPGITMTCM